MKIRLAGILSGITILGGTVINKLIERNPRVILPTPAQQLNTHFEESKVIFKFVDTSNISTYIVIICIVLLAVIWYSVFKKKGE
jgi:hypothetical protein